MSYIIYTYTYYMKMYIDTYTYVLRLICLFPNTSSEMIIPIKSLRIA